MKQQRKCEWMNVSVTKEGEREEAYKVKGQDS